MAISASSSVNLAEQKILIQHYHTILQQAEYAYIDTNTLLRYRCSLLFKLACESSILHDTPLILVLPGLMHNAFLNAKDGEFDKLCAPFGADFPRDASLERLSLIKSGTRRSNRNRSQISSALHLMRNEQERWNERKMLQSLASDNWSEGTTEYQAIQQAVFNKNTVASQIVISQDLDFLKSLRQMCAMHRSDTRLLPLSVDESGFLFDPFDSSNEELLVRIARGKLETLVESTALYIDESALNHKSAGDFLTNVKPALLKQKAVLNVLAARKKPLEHSEILVARAQEVPPTVRFVWLDESIETPEALTGALMKEGVAISKLAYITNRVPRAEKIQARLFGTGVHVAIYSINQHGYLSNRDKEGDSSAILTQKVEQSSQKKQIEDSIKSGDAKLETILQLCQSSEILQTGIRTCLCHDKVDLLATLVDNADKISAKLMKWVFLEFRQFQRPAYLAENPQVFNSIVKMLTKVPGFQLSTAHEILEHIAELQDRETSHFVELEFLYELFNSAIMQARGTVLALARIRRRIADDEIPHTPLSRARLLELQVDELDRQIRQAEQIIEQQQALIAKLRAKTLALLNEIPGCEDN